MIKLFGWLSCTHVKTLVFFAFASSCDHSCLLLVSWSKMGSRSFRPMSCSPGVLSPGMKDDSPGVWSRFGRELISSFYYWIKEWTSIKSSSRFFFSDQSYRPRKDEVLKQSQLINHLPIDRLTLFGVTYSYIHPRAEVNWSNNQRFRRITSLLSWRFFTLLVTRLLL